MEVFSIITKPYAQFYKKRTGEIKSCDDHIAHMVRHITGEWMVPMRDASAVLDDPLSVGEMFNLDSVPLDEMCETTLEFVLNLAGEYCLREFPRCYDYPMNAVSLLDCGKADETFEQMSGDWEIIICL